MQSITEKRFWTGGYYIKLSPGTKIPAEPWGGYSQDFETAETVLSWDELKSNVRYGMVGHKDYRLGVVDIDSYKDDAPNIEDITIYTDGDERLVIKTSSGGVHVPYFVDDEFRRHTSVVDGIDIKGELANGHVVMPEHNSDYTISTHGPVPVFDTHEDAFKVVMVDGESVIKLGSGGPDPDYDFDYEIPDESPDDLYFCELTLLTIRASAQRYEYGNSPFDADTHVGMCLLSNGRSIDEAVGLLKEFPPAKDEGFSEHETRYQLNMINDKLQSNELFPPTNSIIESGVDIRFCSCPIHKHLEVPEEDLIA